MFIENDYPVYTLGQVGCPACAGNLDEFHAMGITKVMFCGGGGVLDRNIEVGQILVVDGAIRDEGFSYQYIAPSRVIYTNPEITDKIGKYLDENCIPFLRGLTWTTDAIFRETADRISRRKGEGAKIVEIDKKSFINKFRFAGANCSQTLRFFRNRRLKTSGSIPVYQDKGISWPRGRQWKVIKEGENYEFQNAERVPGYVRLSKPMRSLLAGEHTQWEFDERRPLFCCRAVSALYK